MFGHVQLLVTFLSDLLLLHLSVLAAPHLKFERIIELVANGLKDLANLLRSYIVII